MARNALEKGIAAAKSGNKLLARLHLLEAAERTPQNPICWMWLAWAAESPEDAINALKKALAIDPEHEVANAGLAWARGMAEMVIPVAEAAPSPGSAPPPQAHAHAPSPGFAAAHADRTPGVGVGLGASFGAEPVGTHAAEGIGPGLGSEAVAPAQANHYPIPTLPQHAAGDFGAAVASAVASASAGLGGAETHAAPLGDTESWTPQKDAERKPIVMIVDDSPTVCKLVTITLSRRGYQVISASDGLAAVDLIPKTSPNLILLDITMPGMDGYKLCKIIKSVEHTRHIPVIMLSGKDGFFDKARGRFAGCTSYITKPFDPDSLIQEIERYLPAPVA